MSRQQRETPECSSVGKLTTAPSQKSPRPTATSPPLPHHHHPFSPLSPCPKLLLTCTISQLVQDDSPQQPHMLSSQESIVSLTPCVLCLHHFVEQILPQCTLPSAPRVEFSITSHIHDTLWWVPLRGPGQEGGGYRVSEMRACKPWPLSCLSHTHQPTETHAHTATLPLSPQ